MEARPVVNDEPIARPLNPLAKSPRWPWFALALALAWVTLARVPLMLNAPAHLDSDLAVEGLTLSQAIQGHWRWHYPSATYMGIPPLLLSYPQALIWGANPWTLASGGTVAYLAVVVATFGLAWRAFGPRVAAWSLVPLAFASTGTLWLSARVYGGHLLAAAWHAAAFLLLISCVNQGGWRRAAWLGLWCGLGVYLDKMLVVTVAAIAPVAILAWWSQGRSARALACVPAFGLALVLGYLPHVIGAKLDPFDNYNEQFDPLWNREVLVEHARILALDCTPRLIAGRLLPSLRAETETPVAMKPAHPPTDPSSDPLAWATTALVLGLFAASLVALARGPSPRASPAGQATRRGLLLASAAVFAGFILNRNIFNSDNYRYLVFFLTAWALGFGLLMDALAKRGVGGMLGATLLATTLSASMAIDTVRYYQRFGWITPDGRPARQRIADPSLDWLAKHPEVTHLFGDYWDVYRLSFLTGGRVKGVPYPGFPERFPEWSLTLPDHRPNWAIVRLNTPRGQQARQTAIQSGGAELFRDGRLAIVSWPSRIEGGRSRD